jgi:hypothetical protein
MMKELNPAIYGENLVVLQWYTWIAFVALGVALVGAFWIFYDSQRKKTDPLIWKVLIVVAIVFLIPSIAVAVDERIAQNVIQAVPLLAYLGIGAAATSLVAILAYLAKLGYDAEAYEAYNQPVTQPYQPQMNLSPGGYQPGAGASAIPSDPFIGSSGQSAGQPFPTENVAGRATDAPFVGGGAGGVLLGPAKTELLHKTPEEVAYLIIRSGTRAGKEYRLGEVTTIGRDGQQCEIIIDDTACSGQHARVKLENSRFILHDLASTNGTKVNNSEIARHVLEDGDQIDIGKTKLTFMQLDLGKK